MLAGDFNLEGAGARSTAIQGDARSRVAYVEPDSDITVIGVSVRHGSATGRGWTRASAAPSASRRVRGSS